MKKIILGIMATCLSFTFHPIQAIAATTSTPSTLTVSRDLESEKAKALLTRLDEINAMDKTNLKPSEKRSLRREVRSIKHDLKTIGGGVYISVGAIIIILILLLILF